MKSPSLDPNFPIDVERLIETRLLIQAGSGGGKSWAIRRLAEQTFHSVQQIIIDVEDEFQTLRQKFDYVLAGKNGDCPADVRCAAQLAHKLLELRVSTIVSISELKYHDRIRFVKLFLDALVESPRELWHPVLVVVDEAQCFAPQAREAESVTAVIDLMTRGRKRGLAGVLATQRISKVHKDAIAECNNKLIGMCSLDVDMKRSADELGFTSREEMHALRKLNPGEFYAFGPALTKEVKLITVGGVQTSHPKIGQRHAAPPPPTVKVKKALEKLADLPAQVEQERLTTSDLQKRVRDLEAELRKNNVKPDPNAINAATNSGYDKAAMEFRKRDGTAAKFLKVAQKNISDALGQIEIFDPSFAVESPSKGFSSIKPIKTPMHDSERKNVGVSHGSRSWASDGSPLGDVNLGKCERAILTVLAQLNKPCSKSKIAISSTYSVKSSGFNNALSVLRTLGLIDGGGEAIRITEDGFSALGEYNPLPTGKSLIDYHIRSRGKCEAAILEYLTDQYPVESTKETVASGSGYSASSSGFNNSLSVLRTLGLIEGRGDALRASRELMEG